MMDFDKKDYKKYAAARAPKSPCIKNCAKAFLIGGLICALGQGFLLIYKEMCGLEEEIAGTLTSVTLIFLAILLTAIGIFDKIAKHAGAGTLVPITGFANSVCAPAMEFRREGMVMGLGAKLFTVAGPVIVFGTAAGVVYGIVLMLLGQG